jgi:RNA polymerase primary sigma factor
MKSYNSKIIPVLRDMTDKLYIADIDKLTPAKFPNDAAIRELVDEYRKNGNMDARDAIIMSFGRYVVSIAKNYQEQGLPLSDLISEGMIGLIAAIEQFDTTQTTTKFVTYSNVSISRQMKEALDQFNRPVKVPKNIRNSQMKMREKLHNDQLHGKELSDIVEEVEDVDYEFALNPKMFSRLTLTTRNEEDEDDPMENSLLLSGSDSPMDQIDFNTDLDRVFARLTENEVKVIRAFFGFSGDYLKSSIKLVGESLDMTPEQVRKLKLSGLQKLRDEKSRQILSKYL